MLALAAFMLITGVSEARAQFFTGNHVHSWCQNDRSRALAYTAGLFDAAQANSFKFDFTFGPLGEVGEKTKDKFVLFCAPEDVVLGQVVDVFCSYLEDVSQDRQKSATRLFDAAMKKAWPCPKQ